ncbi:TadE/TadG family type IV pilus assembly protein [Methylobacterium sp. GC_Met_2]|uniref:TadE/TadG family type IV pilus assembly protein n=1 Tax=Methylobacterium sp. GC_Met_2 TaxID=2937376 RepID=UPI00226B2EB7
MATRVAEERGGCARFCDAQDGTAAVEFAMIGGLLIFLSMGIMQVGLYVYTSAALENAVAKASRQIMTGAASAGTLTAAQFRSNVLCPALPSGLSCANIITNINTIPEASSPGGFYQYVNSQQSWIIPPSMDNTKTSFCTGTGGSVIYAQVYYAMPVLFPALIGTAATTWGGRSVYFVGSFAAFRNEPFQSSSNTGC